MRNRRGNMLILVVAVLLAIGILFCFFGLGFVRLLGTSAEQTTAIEAAALAAARDLSRIVIDTPEFGLVGISDSAPNAGSAGDGFGLPVHGINSIIGTARLDYIIGDQLGINEWKELALQDLDKAKNVAVQLETTLKDAVKKGGSAQDKNGASVKPYASAESAYLQNQIRMSGASNYVSNSLQLSLGALSNGVTTTVGIPIPSGTDSSLTSDKVASGRYKAYVNIPYDGEDFVFAGIADSMHLVNPGDWVATVSGLPYQMATVVRAEASQMVSTGTSGQNSLTGVACAVPASLSDVKPAPGALVVSFPDGMPEFGDTLTNPMDVITKGFMSSSPDADCEFLASNTGDYPLDSGANLNVDPGWPLSDPAKLASNVCKVAYYDWIKRAGTKADISSITGMMSTPFDPQGPDVPWPVDAGKKPKGNAKNIPSGIMHIYRFEPNGKVSYQSTDTVPIPYCPVSHSQVHAECYGLMKDSAAPIMLNNVQVKQVKKFDVEFTGNYDMYVKIFGRYSGELNGGKHGGEPLDDPDVAILDLDNRSGLIAKTFVFEGLGAKGPPPKPNKPSPLPQITPRSDFMWKYTTDWAIYPNVKWTTSGGDLLVYRTFDTGSGIRPTYEVTGFASEIRFRRVIKYKDIADAAGTFEEGYIGHKFGDEE